MIPKNDNKPAQKAKLATLNNQMTKEMVSIMYLRQGKLKVVVGVLCSQKCRSVADEFDAKTPVCPLIRY